MAPRLSLSIATEVFLAATVAMLAAFGASEVVRMTVADLPVAAAVSAPIADELADDGPATTIALRDPFQDGQAGDELPLVLWGVAIDGDDARAVIEDTSTKKQDLYRVGDEIGGARIAAIGWDHVTLRTGDDEATLALATAADRAPTPSDTRVAEAEASGPDGDVRRVSNDAFVVDRRAVETIATNGGTLATQMRAIAEVRDGRPSGFRVFKIEDGSLVAKLGIRNGDVVERLNGAAVTDPAGLLGFLDRLRTEPRVAVDIVRGGERRTLVYDLR